MRYLVLLCMVTLIDAQAQSLVHFDIASINEQRVFSTSFNPVVSEGPIPMLAVLARSIWRGANAPEACPFDNQRQSVRSCI